MLLTILGNQFMDIFNVKKIEKLTNSLIKLREKNKQLKQQIDRLIIENIKLSKNQNISGLQARVEQAPNIPSFDIPPKGFKTEPKYNNKIKHQKQVEHDTSST